MPEKNLDEVITGERVEIYGVRDFVQHVQGRTKDGKPVVELTLMDRKKPFIAPPNHTITVVDD